MTDASSSSGAPQQPDFGMMWSMMQDMARKLDEMRNAPTGMQSDPDPQGGDTQDEDDDVFDFLPNDVERPMQHSAQVLSDLAQIAPPLNRVRDLMHMIPTYEGVPRTVPGNDSTVATQFKLAAIMNLCVDTEENARGTEADNRALEKRVPGHSRSTQASRSKGR